MKRKILPLMMIAALSASLLTGCGAKAEAGANSTSTSAPAATEATTEKATEAVTEAEIETTAETDVSEAEQELNEYYTSFDVYASGLVEVAFDDGAGGTDVEQMMSCGFSSFSGKTVEESMKEFGMLGIEVVPDGDTFEGWMEYRDVMAVDEDGFEYHTSYEKVSDMLYTTEDVLSMILDTHTTFIAKWESIPYEEYALTYESAEDGLDLSVTVYGNGGNMIYGGEDSYESNLAAATIESGFSLATYLGDHADLTSVEREGYAFNGWCVYASDEIIYTVGLEEALNAGSFCVSLEEYGYAAMNDYVVVNEFATTEELYEIVCDGSSYLAVANWVEKELLLCSGCETEKLCGKYDVDGQTYIVCDDCYNEFATGMGLKND